jgi:hypothetical protein
VPSESKSLTGNSATSHFGSLKPSASKSLTGVYSTSHQGSFLPNPIKDLTGNHATSAVGSLSPSSGKFIDLTGDSATSHVGSFTPNPKKYLTGDYVTSHVGSLSPSSGKFIDLTGEYATAHVGSLAPAANRSISLIGEYTTAHVGSIAGFARFVDLTGVYSTTEVGSFLYSALSAPWAQIPPVPTNLSTVTPWWVNQIAQRLNLVMTARVNATSPLFTFAANASSTTLMDSRIGVQSTIVLIPTTPNASSLAGAGWYLTNQTTGSVVVNHENNTYADRSYEVIILG